MTIIDGMWSISGVTFLLFCVFAIAAVGYVLGRITIKGVNLGTGGVFIIALVFGALFYNTLSGQLSVGDATYAKEALKIIDTLGLILFVTAVGFIAGPKFFGNLKKYFSSYIVLGVMIILSGAAACIGCILVGRNFTDLDPKEFTSIIVGLFAGALTSTPAFTAGKDAASGFSESFVDAVSTGYGISYLFGVVGVVLFIQLVPKMLKADMEKERKLISAGDDDAKKTKENLINMDGFGIMPFALAAILGVLIGSFKVQGFSLTTTGGCLLTALVFGHFGRIGKISIMPSVGTLKVFRELGLMLFLIGAGISGGSTFVKYFEPVYFLYGIIITIVPMVLGFLFAKYVLKLNLLSNLGSITGGMTSTPALGTLINVSGTEDVASAYAATYPIALIAVVVSAQLIMMFF